MLFDPSNDWMGSRVDELARVQLLPYLLSTVFSKGLTTADATRIEDGSRYSSRNARSRTPLVVPFGVCSWVSVGRGVFLGFSLSRCLRG